MTVLDLVLDEDVLTDGELDAAGSQWALSVFDAAWLDYGEKSAIEPAPPSTTTHSWTADHRVSLRGVRVWRDGAVVGTDVFERPIRLRVRDGIQITMRLSFDR
jgi:hypothetical protein